jgi:hypothetical protein
LTTRMPTSPQPTMSKVLEERRVRVGNIGRQNNPRLPHGDSDVW